jgi:hypothetical protein
LKNVYSVFKYPDQKSSRNWQPQVGLKSLIDPSVASADFYAVRNKQQSLETVSGGNGGPVVTSSGRGSGAAQHRVVSTAIIAACSVIGFFVLAAAAFCAWWFWLRRKNGQNAIVDYKLPPEQDEEKSGSNHKAMNSESTLRSRKHEETKRQKSMVDGFSDYEVESWRTNTEGESIGLASLREVDEYDSLVTEKAAVLGETLSNHTRGSSLHQGLLSAHYSPPMQLAPLYPERPRRHSRGRERDRDRDRRHSDCGMRPIGSSLDRPLSHQFQRSMSAQLLTVVPTTLSPMSSTGRLVDVQTTSPPTSPTLMSPQPSPGLRAASIHSMRSGSISMSGPFPGRHLSYGDLDEFFPVLPATSPSPKERSRRASHSSQRRSSSQPRI